MSVLQDCAEKIIEMMTYCDKSNMIMNEARLNDVFESMLIFLDYDDMIDIMERRVIPRLLPKINSLWYDYYTSTLKFWRDCLCPQKNI